MGDAPVSLGIIFPGQGTQHPGMGRPWRSSAHWQVVVEAAEALGEPLESLLLEAPEDVLARTREAQLAVFLHSLVAWHALREEVEAPRAFAGHSLGQVTALVAAGVLSVTDGVRLAARRAEVTQAAADARPGRLLALVGADLATARAACRDLGEVWVANDNAPGQVVVGGAPEAVEAAAARAAELGVRRTIRLNVGGAFHTPLMAPAAEALAAEVATMTFREPVAPVVSNVDGRAYADGAGWRQRLAAQLVCPVRWRSCMATLAALEPELLVEVGPGAVLAGLARRCAPALPVRPVAAPADLATLGHAAGSRRPGVAAVAEVA